MMATILAPLEKPLSDMLITDLLREYGRATLARSSSVNRMDDFIFWCKRLEELASESLRRDAELSRLRELDSGHRSGMTWQDFLDAQDESVRAQFGEPLEREEVIDSLNNSEFPT